MKHFKNLIIGFLTFGLFFSGTFILYGQKIRVAVAANAQFVAQALKQSFEKRNQTKVELIVGSSGKLTAQITHGAPYDIFLSADMKYPENLYKAGATINKPQVYASGSLVVWSIQNNGLENGLSSLTSSSIKTIAVANPATAPYGVATIQALKKAGIYGAVKDKIVYGESISQVNQYLLSGAADVAFTAKSVVMDPALKQKGRWVGVPDNLYLPIEQGMVILQYASKNLQSVKAFYEYLISPEGKSIFKSYGYSVQ